MNRLSEDIPNLKHTIKKEELGVQTWKIERLLERAKAGCTVLHPLATAIGLSPERGIHFIKQLRDAQMIIV
jgi:hypothetical protein